MGNFHWVLFWARFMDLRRYVRGKVKSRACGLSCSVIWADGKSVILSFILFIRIDNRTAKSWWTVSFVLWAWLLVIICLFIGPSTVDNLFLERVIFFTNLCWLICWWKVPIYDTLLFICGWNWRTTASFIVVSDIISLILYGRVVSGVNSLPCWMLRASYLAFIIKTVPIYVIIDHRHVINLINKLVEFQLILSLLIPQKIDLILQTFNQSNHFYFSILS